MRHIQDYQEFGRQREKCREDLMLGASPLEIRRSVDALQGSFEDCLAAIATPTDRLQAFNVEISKQLKLLRMDCLFLQTAKQSATIAQRQAQMLGRLDLLKAYGDAVLEL